MLQRIIVPSVQGQAVQEEHHYSTV